MKKSYKEFTDGRDFCENDFTEMKEKTNNFFDTFKQNKLSEDYVFSTELKDWYDTEYLDMYYEWRVTIKRKDGEDMNEEEFSKISEMFDFI